MNEIRHTLRVLKNSPGFTALAATALALGIGANTAIFSVVYVVMLRPLPYPQPGRLMTIWDVHPKDGRDPASYPNYVDWRTGNQVFENMAGFTAPPLNLTGIDTAEVVWGARVTASFFPTLGI